MIRTGSRNFCALLSLVLLIQSSSFAAVGADLPCKEVNLVESLGGQDQVCVQTNTGSYWQVRASNIEDIDVLDYEPIYDGFELQIYNYEKFIRYEVVSNSGVANLDSSGLVTVTGDLKSTGILEIRAFRGALFKVLRYSGKAFNLQSIPAPKLAPYVESDGYAEIEILNFNQEFYYEIENNKGDISIDNFGMIGISNYDEPLDATFTLRVSLEGYKSSYSQIRFGEVKELPTPLLSSSVSTSTSSFEFDIKNYDSSLDYKILASLGKVVISNDGHVTVYALEAGQSSTVQITSYSAGIQSLVTTLIGRSKISFQKVTEKELSLILLNLNKNIGKGFVFYAQLSSIAVPGNQDYFLAKVSSSKLKPVNGLKGKLILLDLVQVERERLLVGDFVQAHVVLRATTTSKVLGKSTSVGAFEVVKISRY